MGDQADNGRNGRARGRLKAVPAPDDAHTPGLGWDDFDIVFAPSDEISPDAVLGAYARDHVDGLAERSEPGEDDQLDVDDVLAAVPTASPVSSLDDSFTPAPAALVEDEPPGESGEETPSAPTMSEDPIQDALAHAEDRRPAARPHQPGGTAAITARASRPPRRPPPPRPTARRSRPRPGRLTLPAALILIGVVVIAAIALDQTPTQHHPRVRQEPRTPRVTSPGLAAGLTSADRSAAQTTFRRVVQLIKGAPESVRVDLARIETADHRAHERELRKRRERRAPADYQAETAAAAGQSVATTPSATVTTPASTSTSGVSQSTYTAPAVTAAPAQSPASSSTGSAAASSAGSSSSSSSHSKGCFPGTPGCLGSGSSG